MLEDAISLIASDEGGAVKSSGIDPRGLADPALPELISSAIIPHYYFDGRVDMMIECETSGFGQGLAVCRSHRRTHCASQIDGPWQSVLMEYAFAVGQD